ncbi:hypothetical protein KXV85_000716, partial [Aspergillus fumigatus]
MANSRGLAHAKRLVAHAIARGAKLLAGGKQPASKERGFFFEPTVLGEVPDAAVIMQEEPFAPIAPIARFRNLDEVIARANATPFGLTGYVFSQHLTMATFAAEALEVGMVVVNEVGIASAEAPFGGIKESGMGREGGSLVADQEIAMTDETNHGLSNGLTNYGDRDFALYLRKSFARSMGYSNDMLSRPIVGIAYTPSGFNNCHRHFPELLDAAKRGVIAAGGLPLEFPTVSL